MGYEMGLNGLEWVALGYNGLSQVKNGFYYVFLGSK